MKALIDSDIFQYEFGNATDNEYVPLNWPLVQARIQSRIDKIMEATKANSYQLYLTSDDKSNFRYDIATIKPYKGNRPTEKPYWYQHIRNFLVDQRAGYEVYGREADDQLVIDQTAWLKEHGVRLYVNENQYMILDWDDYQTHKHFNWSLNTFGYVQRESDRANERNIHVLHREIMDNPEGYVVDHINGNILDNRKCNLRVCTVKENVRNGTSSSGSSQYKGVYWDKEKGKWCAQIKVDRKSIHLGRFSDEKDAAKKYDEAAENYFGEFAKLNFGTVIHVPEFEECVISSRDKDLWQALGLKYCWGAGKQKEKPMWWQDEIEGLRCFYKQLLTGDSVDNIPGLYGVGPSSVLLGYVSRSSTEIEMFNYVHGEYVKRFGSYANQFLLENGRLLWMLREENEIWQPPTMTKQ